MISGIAFALLLFPGKAYMQRKTIYLLPDGIQLLIDFFRLKAFTGNSIVLVLSFTRL